MEHEPSPVTQPITRVGPPTVAFHPFPAVAPVPASAPVPQVKGHRVPRFWIWALTLAVAATLALGGYLLATTNAWQHRAAELDRASRDLGSQLSGARADLQASKSQLDSVTAQLATAQTRITQLADEKAQLGDDREAQRRLADYQARATAAAAQVASAMDKCIAGQQQYIGYLKDASAYNPTELAQFGTDVAGYCQTATNANASLQQELRK